MSADGKLCVIWSSADRDVALGMVFMYTKNAKKRGWWDEVRLVVWGPSAILLTEDQELKDALTSMKEVGVELQACRACADMQGVSDQLTELGIDVIYMGMPLTEMLKGDWKVLTF